MPVLPAANPNVPHIDRPLADIRSLATVAEQMRQGVESLGGNRGTTLDRAVTLSDLIVLGLVTQQQVLAALRET
jgi:hypothetical protein